MPSSNSISGTNSKEFFEYSYKTFKKQTFLQNSAIRLRIGFQICIFAKITSKTEQFHAHFIWRVFRDWKIFIQFLQCAMCWNWPKTAISWELPDFRKISGKISGQLEFWNSALKIKFSDKNWVGKIPITLKLVKIRQFQAISRFPDFQIPDSRKSQMSPKVCKIIVNMLY